MTTTFNAISIASSSRSTAARAARALIIGVALAMLVGCSALRLGYNNASQLSWWWVDGYFDFSSAQSAPVRRGLDGYFEWHRRTQLPELAALLAAAGPAVLQPTTAELACTWFTRVRERLDPAIDRAVVQFADIVPTLDENNFKQLEKRHAESLRDMREEFLQADPADRRAESIKRTVERAEQIYGSLDEPQIRVIRAGLENSLFNPDAWLVERQRRQTDTVQTLRRLVAEKAGQEQRVAALRSLVERSQTSPSAEYRSYQRQLTQANCKMAASIHNATTPAQRANAQSRLKGWEEDLRALIVAPAAPQ